MAGATENGLEVVTVEQAEQLSIEAGATPEQATAIAADYGAAQLDGLRRSLGVVAMFAVLGLWFTRRLPRRPRQTIDRDPGPAPPVAASA